VFVSKLSADASHIVYSTYLGGSGDDSSNAVALGKNGALYLAGTTNSTNFPTTRGALSTAARGDSDAFVVKLAPDGTHLLYSTYLGGTGVDVASNVVVDGTGAVYVAGTTRSENFPATKGAFASAYQGSNNVLYVSKFSPDGRRLLYSTLIGESGGYYFGGLAVDRHGAAYVTSTAYAKDFPTTKDAFSTRVAGSYDAIVSKVAPDGQSLQYSTFLGGNASDTGNGIVVDDASAAYVIGSTTSTNLPTTIRCFPRRSQKRRRPCIRRQAGA